MKMDAERDTERIASDLEALGVRPGETILVHSSLRSLGPVAGGIETVIRGLLRVIGPGGTLLVPALSLRVRPPVPFNPRLTPASIGAIPEYFRTRPGTLRSIHPTHSVCATGRRAEELLAGHHLDRTPCGPRSPFRKLCESGGTIVMLGCGLRPNTTMHALEECRPPPYLFGGKVAYTILEEEGLPRKREYTIHGFTLHRRVQRYDRVAGLESAGRFLRRGKVLEATTFLLDAPLLKSAVLSKLEEDPCFFVDPMLEEPV